MAKAAVVETPEEQEPRDASAIKDAYSKWLAEMYHAAPRKRKSKKKSMRLAALRHLQQPTESSAKKHFSLQESETSTAPVAINSDAAAAAQLEAQKRRFQVLAAEANYAHYQYEAPWCPGLAFFGLLASHAKSKAATAVIQQGAFRRDSSKAARSEIANFPVRMPPTVLRLSQSDGVVLMFTTEQQPPQEVEPSRRSLITSRMRWPAQVDQSNNSPPMEASEWLLQFHYFRNRVAFESRLPWILRVLTADTADSPIVAVLKTTASSTAQQAGNRLEILPSVAAVEAALRSLWEDDCSGDLKAVQSYVCSKGSNHSFTTSAPAAGSSKAWIARPAYRKKDQSATTVWILTGNDTHFASTEWKPTETSPPCQIVKCANAQSWVEPRVIVETMCQFVDVQVLRSMGAGAFAELVVDLVQDVHGHWWLLQIKALQLRRSQLPPAVSIKDSSRARSAPDRLETMSVLSASTRELGSSSQPRAKWKCAGKYCHSTEDGGGLESDDQAAEPSGYLTKKELLSCEFYDKYRNSGDASVSSGCGSLSNALAFYLQHQLHKRERTALYESQPLCGSCLRRYYALRVEYATHVGLEGDGGSQQRRKSTKTKAEKRLVASQSLEALPNAQRRAPAMQTLPPLSVLKTSASVPGVRPVVAPPSYLDELDRIERLLNGEDEPQQRSPLKQQLHQGTEPADSQLDTQEAAASAPVTSTSSLSWLQNPTGEDRVDEMWQSIKPKPLVASSAASLGGSRAYNTFSLQAALREGMDASLRPTASFQAPLPPASSEPHLISITDSRRVFSDESFRESLAREATRRLIDARQSVRFVVLLADDESGGPQDSSVGRMALRSIALDVMQLLDQEGVGSSSGLPPVHGDAAGSGYLLMTILAPSL